MKYDIKQLKALKGQLFKKQSSLLPLWQTLAEYFYPERADFVAERTYGQEFTDHLIDLTPLIFRRDLANSFSAMLRDGEWFEIGVDNFDSTYDSNAWLQHSTTKLRQLINAKRSGFVRSTKQGDNDYTTFGNAVISCEPNQMRTGLQFRSHHLRECAWAEDETGHVDTVVKAWRPTVRDLMRAFDKEKLHAKVIECVTQHTPEPFKEIPCFHIVMPSDMYGDDELTARYEWVSIYVDEQNDHIIEVTGLNHKYYAVPRFATLAGSPYAYSTAAVIGLPNARCLQAMTHTLMEAAERIARPPIIATEQAVRSDVDLSPDGITWVNQDYDEKLGASLRTLDQRGGSWPIGDQERANVADTLRQAFYLDSLSLPETNREMTAYEVSERMKQFRRQNLPLFQPIEIDYNGQLMELAFEVAMSSGFFGSVYDVPEELQGKDVSFKFESPLTASEGEEKMHQFSQMSQLLREAAENDPGVRANVNFDSAFRDAVEGAGAPMDWLLSPEQATEVRQQQAIQEAMIAATGSVQQA